MGIACTAIGSYLAYRARVKKAAKEDNKVPLKCTNCDTPFEIGDEYCTNCEKGLCQENEFYKLNDLDGYNELYRQCHII